MSRERCYSLRLKTKQGTDLTGKVAFILFLRTEEDNRELFPL